LTTVGRVSLKPRHVLDALPEDERVSVELLEHHLWNRQRRAEPALEVLPDGGVGVFLTIGHVQGLLRQIGARKTGEDFAAEILNTILPRLGLLEDTGLTKKPKPRTRDPRATAEAEGGRHAQNTLHRSHWWRVFRLPTVAKLVTPRFGAYPPRPGTEPPRHWGTASLVGLLRSQGLIPRRRRRSRVSAGSVQAAFWATGPP
jgi:hypothetical protein